MRITSDPDFKVKRLQRLAQDYNTKLITEFPDVNFASGGNLFLGKHYCKSNRIFLSLNPGGKPDDFKTNLEQWNFWDCPNSGYAFWANCRFFVKAAEGLHDWIGLVTAAFCSPWRTLDGKKLQRLNTETNGELFRHSGELVRRLIEDHKEVTTEFRPTLIVAGRESLYRLSSPAFLHFNWNNHQKFHNGATGTYQWAKIEWDRLVIYQVPHFSRANSHGRLKECAEWLARDLEL
jgi:hypothetical protein